MFDPMAFAKLGAAAEKHATVVFYKGFSILARDSDLREACDDDQTVALGALSLTSDLLTGAVTPEHLIGDTFRDMAFQRGLEKIAERALQDTAARKPAPKSKPCEILLHVEPDDELTNYLHSEGFKRVGELTDRPVIFEGLGSAKALKACLHSDDRIIFRTVVTGTRRQGSSSEAQPDVASERDDEALPPGVAPYVIATIDAPDGVSLQKASLEQLTDTIVRVGHIEGPLNKAVLVKRLRRCFDLRSIKSMHENKIDAAIQAAIDEGHLRRTEDNFLISTAVEHVVPRFRTSEDEDVRATSAVSRIEIRAAVALQMKIDPERDPGAIVIGTARMLGFAFRTQYISPDLSDNIKTEVAALYNDSSDGYQQSTQ